MIIKKIIILGSNGQLGQSLKHNLRYKNIEAYSRKECDISDLNNLLETIGNVKNSIIINAAAYTNVEGAEAERELALNINSTALQNISSICHKGNNILFHFSTDYVFNGSSLKAYNEEDQISPINYYGETKALGEEYIQSILKKFYIFRTSWVYGEHGQNFPSKIIELLKSEKNLKIVNDQISVPTSTDFLTQCTGAAIDKILIDDAMDFGIYNLVPDGSCSKYELAKEINNFFKSNQIKYFHESSIDGVGSSFFPTKAKRPIFSVLDNSKFRDKSGFHIKNWQVYLTVFLENYLKKISFK